MVKKGTRPTARIPAPNEQHPVASLIRPALASLSHSASYHSFIRPPRDAPAESSAKTKARPLLPKALPGSLEVAKVHDSLLPWYHREKRTMPWRKEWKSDMTEKERGQRGYEVWVSEIMLQQTQVTTVIGYWERWMKKFPTVQALANADIEEVNAVWAGLGYYSRASRLLSGAKRVVAEFDGILPIGAKELEKVDGVGPYSAGAIASIAFGQRAALVDGNVTRVFSRLTALHASAPAKATTNFIWALADRLVPAMPKDRSENLPGTWNQAVMELGATVCTAKNPNCEECPIAMHCLAYAEVRELNVLPLSKSESRSTIDIEDLCTLCSPLPSTPTAGSHLVTQYPMAKERKKQREEETAVCVVEWTKTGTKQRKTILFKRPEKGLLAGLFEFPAVDLPPTTDSTVASRRQALQKLLSTLFVDPVSPLKEARDLGAVLQIYSHQKRLYHILHLTLSSDHLPKLREGGPSKLITQSLPGRGKWVDRADVKEGNIGGACGKVWETVLSGVRGDAAEKVAKSVGKALKKRTQELDIVSDDAENTVAESSASEPEPAPQKLKRRVVEVEEILEDKPFVARKKRVIQATSDGED